MRNTIPAWVSEYIGVPFVESGAALSGADCYGLVSMIMSDQTGSPLPKTPAEGIEQGWYEVPVNDVRRGDVVLFRMPAGAIHVALMVTDEHYIETRPGATSAIRRVSHFSGRVQVWRRT